MSIRDEIIEDLLETLRGIQVGAGYSRTIKQVWPWVRAGKPAEVPVIYVEEGVDRAEDLASGILTRTLAVSVHLVDSVSFTASDRPDKSARAVIADIEAAVLSDYTRGGNAIDTSLVSSEPFLLVEGTVYARVELEILYQVSRTDPHATTD